MEEEKQIFEINKICKSIFLETIMKKIIEEFFWS